MRSVTVRACLGLLVAGALAGGILAAGPADATTAATPHWRVTVITPPANPASELRGVACPTSTWCAAVGWDGELAPEVGTQAYFALAESRGTWSPATTGVLPPGVTSLAVNINGIACAAKGSCVAVGVYSGTHGSAFIAVEQHGIWQRAFQPRLPRGAAGLPNGVLHAVSCTGPGSCEAVGSYDARNGQFLPMSVTESGGRWRRATGIAFPPHTTPDPADSLSSIACTHAGSCVAVGRYTTTDGDSYAAAAALQVRGHWRRAAPLKLPAGVGPLSQLNSVSCQPSGECVAVGTFITPDGQLHPMMATLSHGHWSVRLLRRVPTGAPRGTRVDLTAISCARTFCLAAGVYSRRGTWEWIVIRIQGGAWATATEIRVPASNPDSLGLTPAIDAVSCSRSGTCAVVGRFKSKSGAQALAAISS